MSAIDNVRLDRDWISQAIMLPKYNVQVRDSRHNQYRRARYKFTDTTLGGNFAINPVSQWPPSADVRVSRPFQAGVGEGMGRAYSTLIDDNAQIIHLRFGVPQYNSLTTFFTGFYNHEAAVLARTGRAPSVFYRIGRAIGFVVTIPLMPLIFAGNLYRFLANKPASKFYYLKPAMATYWQAANTLANGIAVSMGIIPRVLSDSDARPEGTEAGEVTNDLHILDDVPNFTQSDVERLHNFMPEIYKRGGGVDLYSVATRAQRMADRTRQLAIEAYERSTSPDELRRNFRQHLDQLRNERLPGSYSNGGLEAHLTRWSSEAAGGARDSDQSDSDSYQDNSTSWLGSFVEHARAELRDGSAFVSFRVNYTGSVSYSWNNETQESEVKSKFNSASASAQSTRFDFAEGNLGSGAIATTIGAAVNALKDLAAGVASTFNVDGLVALAGNAFVDIPDRWSNSTASLPTMTYTMELKSMYGNKMARFQKIFIPIAMLLAGALPKSAGKSSYTQPFLVELYDKGKNQIRLGIIDSIGVELGSGNMGFNQEHEALSATVTLSIKDLSSIMHMPLNASPGLFDETNTYTDFLATLGSMGLQDQIYSMQRLKINATRMLTHYRSYTSPAKWANMAVASMPGQMITGFARMTDRSL